MPELDTLDALYGDLVTNAILVQLVATVPDAAITYDVVDTWWDMSIWFKSERLFPDQTRRGMSYEETVAHCQHILVLIKKFYPGGE